MRDFKGKVAVVTGAASGIGKAMAERFAAEGMKVVLADIERVALAKAYAEMRENGATVLAVRTDVSKIDDVKELTQKTLNAFGAVDILCNNAGVMLGGFIWENTLAEWEWVMGVNLWGVIHGIQVFVPIMLRQDTESHIVNTASITGIVSPAFTGIYNVTKHAILTLSETLYQELRLKTSKVKVSVLCPLFTNTRLMDASRNSPIDLQKDAVKKLSPPGAETVIAFYREAMATGTSPKEVANCVLNAIKDGKFYIFPDLDKAKELVQAYMNDILEDRNPQGMIKTLESFVGKVALKFADK